MIFFNSACHVFILTSQVYVLRGNVHWCMSGKQKKRYTTWLDQHPAIICFICILQSVQCLTHLLQRHMNSAHPWVFLPSAVMCSTLHSCFSCRSFRAEGKINSLWFCIIWVIEGIHRVYGCQMFVLTVKVMVNMVDLDKNSHNVVGIHRSRSGDCQRQTEWWTSLI